MQKKELSFNDEYKFLIKFLNGFFSLGRDHRIPFRLFIISSVQKQFYDKYFYIQKY